MQRSDPSDSPGSTWKIQWELTALIDLPAAELKIVDKFPGMTLKTEAGRTQVGVGSGDYALSLPSKP